MKKRDMKHLLLSYPEIVKKESNKMLRFNEVHRWKSVHDTKAWAVTGDRLGANVYGKYRSRSTLPVIPGIEP